MFSFLSALFVFRLFEGSVAGSHRLNEQWHIPPGSWKWYLTEPTLCRLWKMLIRPLIAFKWICFISSEWIRCMCHFIAPQEYNNNNQNVKWYWFIHFFLHFQGLKQYSVHVTSRTNNSCEPFGEWLRRLVQEWHRGLRVSVQHCWTESYCIKTPYSESQQFTPTMTHKQLTY